VVIYTELLSLYNMEYTGFIDKYHYRNEVIQQESFREKGIIKNAMSIEGLEGVNGILAERFVFFDDTGDPASINYACLSDISFISKAIVCSKANSGVCSIAVCPAKKIEYSS